jgi:hypothetical protein
VLRNGHNLARDLIRGLQIGAVRKSRLHSNTDRDLTAILADPLAMGIVEAAAALVPYVDLCGEGLRIRYS